MDSRAFICFSFAALCVCFIHAQAPPWSSEVIFESIPLASEAQQDIIVASSWFKNQYGTQNITYHTLARSGDSFGQTIFGQLMNSKNQVRQPFQALQKAKNMVIQTFEFCSLYSRSAPAASACQSLKSVITAISFLFWVHHMVYMDSIIWNIQNQQEWSFCSFHKIQSTVSCP
jgi:hypothetical protein